MLGLAPDNTVRELLGTPAALDGEKLGVYTERHSSGVDVLPAPMSPEDAELVGEEAIRTLLQVARESYDLVVVDTAPFFYGPMLATLDQTDQLLLLCNPDVPTLKNVRLTLKTLELLSFPEDRLRIVLNRASANLMDRGDVEAALDRNVDWVLPLDPSVPLAVNGAKPAVLASPDAPFGVAMLELARATAGGGDWVAKQQQHRAARLFSFGRN
jgi:pilus assembly protein CpaE